MVKPYRPGLVERLLGGTFRVVNRAVPWFRLGFLPGTLNLVALRVNLRRFNLHDTETREPEAPDESGRDVRRTRSPVGAHNDLIQPAMGMAGTRFGRNVPLEDTAGDEGDWLLDPNPRRISRTLFTRERFVPASSLNVLAAAWIQFMVHDWFSHGKNESPKDVEPIRVPIDDDDPFPQNPMIVPRTRRDPTRSEADKNRPATFVNTETHWWDASQIYGSSAERLAEIRRDPATGEPAADGKIPVDGDGFLLRKRLGRGGGGGDGEGQAELELAGVNGNWWIGLSVLHTVFVREHNAICDRLRIDHGDKDGDWLFEKARLVVAALLAKIHTVEWTPALLDTPTLRFAMRGNWWGALGEEVARGYGRLSDSDEISGIVGSSPDHHGARYALTEEFVSVYRMHSLMPDDFSFRHHADNAPIRTATLPEVSAANTHRIYADVPLLDVAYSLGTEHPGALVLHNFPRHLQDLRRQDSGNPADLAAIDILRDRERGVPRYREVRRLLGMSVPDTFSDLTGGDKDLARELEAVYGSVDKVDMLVGMAAEAHPPGFAFSDTAFRVFILMASRRLKSDRFFTSDFTADVYTQAGLDWVANNTFKTVLLRHLPALAPHLAGVRNGFFPWNRG